MYVTRARCPHPDRGWSRQSGPASEATTATRLTSRIPSEKTRGVTAESGTWTAHRHPKLTGTAPRRGGRAPGASRSAPPRRPGIGAPPASPSSNARTAVASSPWSQAPSAGTAQPRPRRRARRCPCSTTRPANRRSAARPRSRGTGRKTSRWTCFTGCSMAAAASVARQAAISISRRLPGARDGPRMPRRRPVDGRRRRSTRPRRYRAAVPASPFEPTCQISRQPKTRPIG